MDPRLIEAEHWQIEPDARLSNWARLAIAFIAIGPIVAVTGIARGWW